MPHVDQYSALVDTQLLPSPAGAIFPNELYISMGERICADYREKQTPLQNLKSVC